MTTELARTFASQLAEIGDDIPAAGALEPGRLYWLHGVRQAKMPGCFYIKDTELREPPAAPWQADSRHEDEQGWSAPLLKLAIIGGRSQWFIPGEEGQRDTYVRHYEADKGMKLHAEYLCFVEGVTDPMVLSLKGVNKTKPVKAALADYRYGLLKQASRIAKRQLPPWSFWLPFEGPRDAAGKPVYEIVKDSSGKDTGAVVTRPTLVLPADALDSCFVGGELLRWGAELAQEYAGWIKAQRSAPDVAEGEYEVVETKALPAPARPMRNIPRPIEDDSESVPF